MTSIYRIFANGPDVAVRLRYHDEFGVETFEDMVLDRQAAATWRNALTAAIDEAVSAARAQKVDADNLKRQRQQKMRELQDIVDKLAALGEPAMPAGVYYSDGPLRYVPIDGEVRA